MTERVALLVGVTASAGLLVGVRAARKGRFRIGPLLWAALWAWLALLGLVIAETLLRDDYPTLGQVLPLFVAYSILQFYLLLPAVVTCALAQACCLPLTEGERMTTLRAFLIIAASAAACTALGGLLGYVLGTQAPGYYRSIFAGGDDPRFDPAEVGLGLGVTQGAIAGLVVGIAVVLIVAWYRSRLARRQPDDDEA